MRNDRKLAADAGGSGNGGSGAAMAPGKAPPRRARRVSVAGVVGGAVLAGTLAWSYWPTVVSMVATWEREPDYSHGFLVVPIAAYFLWVRRARFPQQLERPCWGGLSLIGVSVALRLVGTYAYIDSLDGWSIPVWLAGVCWLFGGRAFLRWSLPAVGFLFFMVPLPFRAEHMLSGPMQRVATVASCWVLQSLGQPALAEGNTILIQETRLEVEQACSGLRMFVAFLALCVAYAVIARRAAWQKVVVLASVAPIALASNVVRIVATGLLYRYVGSAAARTFSHDAAGWAMMPVAAGLLGLVLWYTGRVVVEVEGVDSRELLRRGRAVAAR